MDIKEIIEFMAAFLSVCVSVMVLGGVFVAHKRGFIKALHHVIQHYHQLLLTQQKKEKK